jgi:hypothetical protein
LITLWLLVVAGVVAGIRVVGVALEDLELEQLWL